MSASISVFVCVCMYVRCMCVCVSVLSHRCSCSARREPCASETREGRTGAQDACSAGTLNFGVWRGKRGGKLSSFTVMMPCVLRFAKDL